MFRRKEEIKEHEKEELGRATWTLLHGISRFYPQHPTDREKEAVRLLFHSLYALYPCRSCAPAFAAAEKMVDTTNRHSLNVSLCNLHNFVNRKIGKPEIPCLPLPMNVNSSFSSATSRLLTAVLSIFRRNNPFP